MLETPVEESASISGMKSTTTSDTVADTRVTMESIHSSNSTARVENSLGVINSQSESGGNPSNDSAHQKLGPSRSRTWDKSSDVASDAAINPQELFAPNKSTSPTSYRQNLDGITINVVDRDVTAQRLRTCGTPSNTTPRSLPRQTETSVDVEEGTPAAEALRANAEIKVTKFGKFGRYFNAQNVRRLFKIPVIDTKKGKPPRVPNFSRGNTALEDEGFETVKAELHALNEEDGDEDVENDPSDYDSTIGSEVPVKDEHSLATDAFSLLGNKPAETVTFLDSKGKTQELSLIKWRKLVKKREKKNARNTYVKGKVIDREHELYTLSIAVMLGLRTSIYLTNDQLEDDKKNKDFWLDSHDFMRVEKFKFRPKGGPKTPAHQLAHTFKFKDYSPLPFAYLRRMFGINEYEFLQSVCGTASFIEFISNAKSGQFFFYSSDGKYMIKTMTDAESKFLRRILPHYFRHCTLNPNTMITKFFGMYRVKLYHLRRNVKFVVMNSVFDTDKPLQSFFDLKGSSLGRDARAGEDVKKDNDVRKNYPDSAFVLRQDARERLKLQLQRDCCFLNEMKIMDYSMLVGVHHMPSKTAGLKTYDSMSGLVFRDSLRPSSSRDSTQHRSFRSTNSKSSFFKRGRCDVSHASTASSRSLAEDQSSLFLKNSIDEEIKPGKRVEFILNDDVFGETNVELENPRDDRAGKPRLLSPHFSARGVVPSSDNSFASNSTLGCDDDDDQSYLDGVRGMKGNEDDNELIRERKLMEKRREKATEQIYWPYHRHYEISGQRRMQPLNGGYVEEEAIEVTRGEKTSCKGCLGDPSKHDPDIVNARLKWVLPDFVTPISDRKDRGLQMDATGMSLPLQICNGSKTGIQYCDGKIYYMGIIDVLQQFNVRKRLEALLRKWGGKGAADASCVHPELYADRFLQFFDEYTQRQIGNKDAHEEEQVVFSPLRQQSDLD